MSDTPTWVIWKYSFGITDEAYIEIPGAHRILKVGTQGEDICIWALVGSGSPSQTMHIRVFGTGQPIADEVVLRMRYLDTVFTHDSRLVWHVFAHYPKPEKES